MNFYVVFFLPSILGLLLYKVLTKENEVKELIINYLITTLFSNLFLMGMLIVRQHGVTNFMSYVQNNFIFSFKYILFSMIFSAVFGIVFAVVKKYLVFSVEVENGRKKK